MRTSPLAVMLGIALAPIAAKPLYAQQIQVSGANRTVAVTATAEVKQKADTATIHIGYELYGVTSDAVTDEAGKTSKAIAEALAAAGVPKDAIQSEGQGTQPLQPFNHNDETPAERAQRQFMATQSWTVRTGADDAAKVLAAAIAAGANASGNIEWSLRDEDALTAEAEDKALKHARAMAEQMAAGLGAKLGELLYASNEERVKPPLPLVAAGAPHMLRLQAQAKELSLSPPDVTRSATVSAVFAVQ